MVQVLPVSPIENEPLTAHTTPGRIRFVALGETRSQGGSLHARWSLRKTWQANWLRNLLAGSQVPVCAVRTPSSGDCHQ